MGKFHRAVICSDASCGFVIVLHSGYRYEITEYISCLFVRALFRNVDHATKKENYSPHSAAMSCTKRFGRQQKSAAGQSLQRFSLSFQLHNTARRSPQFHTYPLCHHRKEFRIGRLSAAAADRTAEKHALIPWITRRSTPL